MKYVEKLKIRAEMDYSEYADEYGTSLANHVYESILFRYKSATVWLDVRDSETLCLSCLESKVRGCGHASKLIDNVIKFARKNGFNLFLYARPYQLADGSRGLELDALIQFYERHGFKFEKEKGFNCGKLNLTSNDDREGLSTLGESVHRTLCPTTCLAS